MMVQLIRQNYLPTYSNYTYMIYIICILVSQLYTYIMAGVLPTNDAVSFAASRGLPLSPNEL